MQRMLPFLFIGSLFIADNSHAENKAVHDAISHDTINRHVTANHNATVNHNVIASHNASTSPLCFQQAGQRYRLDPVLLRAIAIQESHLHPQAVNANRDNNGKITSYDYGLMQINDKNIAKLKQLGIIHQTQDLLTDSCRNIHAGAWILAYHFDLCGVNWNCLGSYNAGFKNKSQRERMRYARQVYNIWQLLRQQSLSQTALAQPYPAAEHLPVKHLPSKHLPSKYPSSKYPPAKQSPEKQAHSSRGYQQPVVTVDSTVRVAIIDHD